MTSQHRWCRTLCSLNRHRWLETLELRIGLGCMRLPASGGDDAASETIAAAANAGITIFDTAHAYGDGAAYGQNERLLSRALRACDADRRARIVTKGGMTRVANAWIPDGRAKAIRADCEGSLAALDGLPIDLYLLHAPDPRTPWPTSVRALARLLDEGLIAHAGLSNVNHHQLQEALDMVEVTAIEVALSVVDDRAVRGGLIEFCAERGIAVIAHSPLGGPRRVRAVARRPELVEIARARDASPEQVALAWLLELSSVVVPIPGARRPETAVSAAQAAQVRLEPGDRALLTSALGWHHAPARPTSRAVDDGEVVLIMGVPGAGKSRRAEDFVAQGYLRLNRDERGGSLRQLSDVLEQSLASGARRIVLDNTYLTRALRSHVVGSAARHGIGVRCIWIDTPLAQAQVNLVERFLDRSGSLPGPEQLQEHARVEPGLLSPTRQMRAFRELEPPSRDEGFISVERVLFERSPRAPARASATPEAVFVAAAALTHPGWKRALASGAVDAPHLVFDWRPDAAADVLDEDVARVAANVSGTVTGALCPHAGGAPVCWCRPPLPGLPLAFARARGIDPSQSLLVGAAPAHRTLATTLGATYRAVSAESH
ncbi:MAG: aldo/keto reductase [Candidatus Dormiibacterota bacterium]